MNFGNKNGFGGDDDFRIDVTPLIDMMFQFLVFFLLTTTFVSNAGFDVELPRSSTAEHKMVAHDIIVAVDSGGKVMYNQEPVSDTALVGILETEHAKRPDVTVIIQADTGVPHGRVIEVMDRVRESGFTKLAVAAVAE